MRVQRASACQLVAAAAMSCARPIKRGRNSFAWHDMGSPHPSACHHTASLPSRYVMRGALPSTGQLSNEDALGVEAEAFWVGWGQAVEQGRGCGAAGRQQAALLHAGALACNWAAQLRATVARSWHADCAPRSLSSNLLPRACPQAFKALMDRMEANFSSDSRWAAETCVPMCWCHQPCHLPSACLFAQTAGRLHAPNSAAGCGLATACAGGRVLCDGRHTRTAGTTRVHMPRLAATSQGHACAAAGPSLAGAAGEIADGLGVEVWTCWWAWQMLHAGCCRRLAACKALCRIPVAGRLPPARLARPDPPHYMLQETGAASPVVQTRLSPLPII